MKTLREVSDGLRAVCAGLDGLYLSTSEVVARLIGPMQVAPTEADIKAIYALVKRAAETLPPEGAADCCRRGPAQGKVFYGKRKTVRPWVWHKPTTPHGEARAFGAERPAKITCCPHCGGVL